MSPRQKNIKTLSFLNNYGTAIQKPFIKNIIALYKIKAIRNYKTAENLILDIINRPKPTKKEPEKEPIKQTTKDKIKKIEINKNTQKILQLNKLFETAKKLFKIVKPRKIKTQLNIVFYSNELRVKNHNIYTDVNNFLISSNIEHPRFQHYKPIKLDDQKYMPVSNILKLLINTELKKSIKIYTLKEIDGQKNKDYIYLKKLLTKNIITGIAASDYLILNEHYIDMIYIKSIYTYNDKKSKYNPLKTKARASDENHAINYRYIKTEINLNYDTFKECIKNEKYKDNECFINSLMDFYENSIFSKTKEGLTREKFLSLLNKSESNIKHGLSIEDLEPFFQKFRIPVRIFDCSYKCIYKYDPRNSNNHNKAYYALLKHSHVYTLNHDLKQLSQKLHEDYGLKCSANTNYYINEKDKYNTFKMINNKDSMIEIIKNHNLNNPDEDQKKEIIFNCVYKTDNLESFLFDITKSGYDPQIKFLGCKIQSINIKLNRFIFIVKSQELLPDNVNEHIDCKDEIIYNKMYICQGAFYDSLFNPVHKSYYSKKDIDILNEYRTVANCCKFSDVPSSKNLIEIDISKAYTSAMQSITKIPIFNEFDIFKTYDGSKINDYYLYIIKTLKTNIYLNKSYNFAYGFILKDLNKEDYEIIQFKIPSFIKDVNYKKIIDDLYNKTISDDEHDDKVLKKMIGNVNIGLLEKSKNTNSRSVMFSDLEECRLFQEQYGGEILTISKEEENNYIKNDLDWDLDVEPTKIIHHVSKSQKDIIYLLILEANSTLLNGFRYIKEQLIQIHQLKMYNDFNKLKTNNINIYSIKTDAFTIHKNDLNIVYSLLNFNTQIGGWRKSKDENINIPSNLFEEKINFKMPIDIIETNEIIINDEYDTLEICEKIINEKRPVMIRANLPGCGKSYIAKKFYELKNIKTFVVCPTNKLLFNYEDSCTFNKFFRIGLDDNVEQKDTIDINKYDCICFDEIYFSSDTKKLIRIKKFCDQNKNKIIIATGDALQLECINEITNTMNYDEYADQCLNMIFQSHINLKIPKRVKTEEDQLKLKRVKNAIFKNDKDFETIIKTYFKFTSNINNGYKNIAYTNETCKKVAASIRKSLNKKNEFEIDEILICREYFTSKKNIFNTNYEYIIKEINEHYITIKETHLKNAPLLTITIEQARTKFIFNYCTTCHSLQGSTIHFNENEINKNITIYNWDHFRTSKKWLWTAITRAEDLNNIFFYKH